MLENQLFLFVAEHGLQDFFYVAGSLRIDISEYSDQSPFINGLYLI
jgi:hypothetical protein